MMSLQMELGRSVQHLVSQAGPSWLQHIGTNEKGSCDFGNKYAVGPFGGESIFQQQDARVQRPWDMVVSWWPWPPDGPYT